MNLKSWIFWNVLAMPLRAIFSVRKPRYGFAPEDDLADVGLKIPEQMLKKVVFPAPLGPMTRENIAFLDAHAHFFDGLESAEILAHIAGFEYGCHHFPPVRTTDAVRLAAVRPRLPRFKPIFLPARMEFEAPTSPCGLSHIITMMRSA